MISTFTPICILTYARILPETHKSDIRIKSIKPLIMKEASTHWHPVFLKAIEKTENHKT